MKNLFFFLLLSCAFSSLAMEEDKKRKHDDVENNLSDSPLKMIKVIGEKFKLSPFDHLQNFSSESQNTYFKAGLSHCVDREIEINKLEKIIDDLRKINDEDKENINNNNYQHISDNNNKKINEPEEKRNKHLDKLRYLSWFLYKQARKLDHELSIDFKLSALIAENKEAIELQISEEETNKNDIILINKINTNEIYWTLKRLFNNPQKEGAREKYDIIRAKTYFESRKILNQTDS